VRTGAWRGFPSVFLVFGLILLVLSGCGDDPVGVPFEVIEETTFAPSLGVDLSQMERLSNGTYVRDLVEGAGASAAYGPTLTVTYDGWLTDGTRFDGGQLTFAMGAGRMPLGFEDGLLGLQVGGTRQVVVAPARGFGGLAQIGQAGVTVPPGSVLVYRMTLDGVM
jgi:FKBP-type peptidyl-prolyl cis-trans isomerase